MPSIDLAKQIKREDSNGSSDDEADWKLTEGGSRKKGTLTGKSPNLNEGSIGIVDDGSQTIDMEISEPLIPQNGSKLVLKDELNSMEEQRLKKIHTTANEARPLSIPPLPKSTLGNGHSLGKEVSVPSGNSSRFINSISSRTDKVTKNSSLERAVKVELSTENATPPVNTGSSNTLQSGNTFSIDQKVKEETNQTVTMMNNQTVMWPQFPGPWGYAVPPAPHFLQNPGQGFPTYLVPPAPTFQHCWPYTPEINNSGSRGTHPSPIYSRQTVPIKLEEKKLIGKFDGIWRELILHEKFFLFRRVLQLRAIEHSIGHQLYYGSPRVLPPKGTLSVYFSPLNYREYGPGGEPVKPLSELEKLYLYHDPEIMTEEEEEFIDNLMNPSRRRRRTSSYEKDRKASRRRHQSPSKERKNRSSGTGENGSKDEETSRHHRSPSKESKHRSSGTVKDHRESGEAKRRRKKSPELNSLGLEMETVEEMSRGIRKINGQETEEDRQIARRLPPVRPLFPPQDMQPARRGNEDKRESSEKSRTDEGSPNHRPSALSYQDLPRLIQDIMSKVKFRGSL